MRNLNNPKFYDVVFGGNNPPLKNNNILKDNSKEKTSNAESATSVKTYAENSNVKNDSKNQLNNQPNTSINNSKTVKFSVKHDTSINSYLYFLNLLITLIRWLFIAALIVIVGGAVFIIIGMMVVWEPILGLCLLYLFGLVWFIKFIFWLFKIGFKVISSCS